MSTPTTHSERSAQKPGIIPTINRQAYVCLLEMAQTCQHIHQAMQTIANQTPLTEAERSQLNQIEKHLCELRQEMKQLGFALIGITSYPYNPLATENFHP